MEAGARADLLEETLQAGVGVGDAVGEVHAAVWLREVVAELQLMLLCLTAVTANTLHELYVVTGLLTPVRIVVLTNRLLKYIWLHTLAIEIFYFTYITDVDFQLPNSFMILNLKIIPIAMSIGIRVTSYETIILIGFDPDCKIKISALEIGVKRIFARLY